MKPPSTDGRACFLFDHCSGHGESSWVWIYWMLTSKNSEIMVDRAQQVIELHSLYAESFTDQVKARKLMNHKMELSHRPLQTHTQPKEVRKCIWFLTKTSQSKCRGGQTTPWATRSNPGWVGRAFGEMMPGADHALRAKMANDRTGILGDHSRCESVWSMNKINKEIKVWTCNVRVLHLSQTYLADHMWTTQSRNDVMNITFTLSDFIDQ